ncbi:MAG: cupredoxin domain-containing protein [Actinomycetota bacterium]
MRSLARFVLAPPLVFAGLACSGTAGPPACEDPQTTSSVEMVDFDYTPACVQAEAGTDLRVVNADSSVHTYSVKDTGLSLDLPAGDEGSLTLAGVIAGTTYRVHCIYHPEMTAALKIV